MKRISLIIAAAVCSAISMFAADPVPVEDSYSGRTGYVNEGGYYVIRPRYAEGHKFSEGLAAVSTGKKWGFINANGRWVVKPQFDYVEDFYRGHAIVRKDGKWGALNLKGELEVPCQFDTAEELADLIVYKTVAPASN